MIAHQNQPITVEGDIRDRERAEMRMGAQLLQATLAFDGLVRKGSSRTEAASRIGRQYKDLDSRIPMALVEVEPEDSEKKVRTCRIEDLTAGMTLMITKSIAGSCKTSFDRGTQKLVWRAMPQPR